MLSLVPGVFAPWEEDGTVDNVRRIAEAADQLGFDYKPATYDSMFRQPSTVRRARKARR